MGKRNRRLAQLDTGGRNWWLGGFSDALIVSATDLLALAHFSSKQTRCSPYALGAIILLVTAFDTWLSEATIGLMIGDEGARKVLNNAIDEKYAEVYRRSHSDSKPDLTELRIAMEVRHEIVHHFPRPGLERQHLPWWYGTLEKKGLFVKYPNPPRPIDDFSFSEKLSSYELAFWVFGVIEAAASGLVAGASGMLATADNFGLYRQIRARAEPEQSSHETHDGSLSTEAQPDMGTKEAADEC